MRDRPSWDSAWMRFAEIISERSIDPRYQVGAVVISGNNTQVLSVGYNGDHAGGPNQVESTEPGKSGCLHAEINALIKLDYNNPTKKRMYVTLSPCRTCAKAIVNASIDEVVYRDEYRDSSGLELLRNSGVAVRRFA